MYSVYLPSFVGMDHWATSYPQKHFQMMFFSPKIVFLCKLQPKYSRIALREHIYLQSMHQDASDNLESISIWKGLVLCLNRSIFLNILCFYVKYNKISMAIKNLKSMFQL